MSDLRDLETVLGSQLRRVLDTIVPTEVADFDEVTSLGRPPATAKTDRHDVAPLEQPGVGYRPRRLATIAAASFAIVGLAGVIAAVERDGDVTPATPVVSDDSAATQGSTVPSTTVDVSVPPIDLPGVFLPTQDLPGFTLTEISATRRPPIPNRHAVRYIRQAANGDVDAMIELTNYAATDFEARSGEKSIIVHGQQALGFDSGEGVVVAWEEAGVAAAIRTWGLSRDDTAALADRSVVDSATGSLGIDGLGGDGFDVSMSDQFSPSDAVIVQMLYSADDRRPGGLVDFTTSPNHDAASLQVFEAMARMAGQTVERTTLADHPAIITTTNTDPLAPIVSVLWIRDEFVLVVSGHAAADELTAFAASVEPATLSDARARRDTLDAAMRMLPAVDAGTLPNGFRVTIRRTGTQANVVCLDDPIDVCEPVIDEHSLAPETQDEVTATIHVDGTTWIVGWAHGTHEPVGVRRGSDDAAPIADTAQGDSGTFVAIALTSGSNQLKFDPDSPTTHDALSAGFDDDLLTNS
jgi:hypothetical protein